MTPNDVSDTKDDGTGLFRGIGSVLAVYAIIGLVWLVWEVVR